MKKKLPDANTVVTCVFNYPQSFAAEAYEHLYTPLRRERITCVSHASVKAQSAAAELAYLAAQKLAGAGDGDLCYSYAENGKPVINGGYISMSHTEGCAAASVSSMLVGVDAEKLRKLDLKIAKRVLTEEELAVLEKADDKSAQLLGYWTAKEACAKLSGEGLSALSRLSYDPASGIACDTAAGRAYSIEKRKLEIPETGGEVLLAVCTEKPAQHIFAVFNDAETIAAYIENVRRWQE